MESMKTKLYIDNSIMENGYTSGANSAFIAQGTITSDKLDLADLKKNLYTPPKVVAQPAKTIDQMVASAQSRLRVFIEAECYWTSLKIHEDFAKLRSK
jgi:hypothetical protein